VFISDLKITAPSKEQVPEKRSGDQDEFRRYPPLSGGICLKLAAKLSEKVRPAQHLRNFLGYSG